MLTPNTELQRASPSQDIFSKQSRPLVTMHRVLFHSVHSANIFPCAPQSSELISFSSGSQARNYLGGDGGGELRVVIDPSVLAVLDDGFVFWLQRGVEQQVKLRL